CLPTYRVGAGRAPQAAGLERPLFPGHLFCQFSVDVCATIVTTPGVVGIVRSDNELAALDGVEIEAIRRVAASGRPIAAWPSAPPGSRVSISTRSRAGIEGTYLLDGGIHRLVVPVTLLHRSIAVEIERELMVPCAEPTSTHQRPGR